ncbi:MAG: protein kinase [Acidobacteria bacterium]|nr:protein kinase [Acidobacteriota bacterium]
MTERAAVETVKIDTRQSKALTPSADPTPVSKLDRYELRRPLGRGGFATVYEAYDPRIKRSVAIKRCSSLDQQNHERFFREAEIAGNLSHANIVRIFDFGVADGTPFIVQELLSGKDLADWIDSGLELSNHDRVHILLQVAEGLAYAHSHGVIHRDIKPANVRVLDDGSIKLLDFGVAAIQDAPSTLTQAGTTVGTAAYLAPEQIRGERPDRATDLFSFGVLAYELLTGHRPFEGETLSAVLYQIAHQQPEMLQPGPLPGRLIRLVHRCLEKQAKRRPMGFEEVVEELREALRDPRLRPPSAETVPIRTYPTQLPSSSPSTPFLPKSTPRLADLPLGDRSPPVRDSSTRIQVAQPRRRTGRVLMSLLVLVGALPAYSYLGGTFPEPVASAIAKVENRLPSQIRAWFDLFAEPAPLRMPVGVASARFSGRVETTEETDPPVPGTTETKATAAAAPGPEPDPVTAAIAILDSRKRPLPPASNPPERPRRRVSSTAPATVFLPPGWHPRMMVSTDGGAFQSLDRRRTRKLEPGRHKLTFRLDTPSYQTNKTLEIDLQPSETRTIESPLAPPGALQVAVVPEAVSGRVEIDGRSLDLPFPDLVVIEPGRHRITFYPSPADPLGPLTKTLNLASAKVHLITFDMRRRRAVVEADTAFEWDGP